jgi:hypothetical protein
MTQDREKISTGPNAEPLDENIAGTAPGIPDDALGPSDEEVPRIAEKIGASAAERGALPLEGE